MISMPLSSNTSCSYITYISGAFLSIHDALVAHFLDKEHNDIGFGWISTLEGIAVVVGMPIAGASLDRRLLVHLNKPFISQCTVL